MQSSVTRRRDAGLWGDGFADDGCVQMQAVRCWSHLDPDEYARLFPCLVPRDGRVPAAVLAHLADRDTRAVPGLSGWVRAMTRALGRSRVEAEHRDAEVARRERHFVETAIAGAFAESLPPATPAQMAAAAFWMRVHPAYLWPAATVMHETLATAAWLGIVASGRPALMTYEVAACLADIIVPCDRGLVLRDGALSPLASRAAPLAVLRDAAFERLSGGRPIVRLPFWAGRRKRDAPALRLSAGASPA